MSAADGCSCFSSSFHLFAAKRRAGNASASRERADERASMWYSNSPERPKLMYSRDVASCLMLKSSKIAAGPNGKTKRELHRLLLSPSTTLDLTARTN